MDRSTKLKEAFKVALAFAIVYGIALKINWMLPSWAGWSVVAIAASSAGQSIQKGIMRLLGTLVACLSAILIIAISTQDRWVFVFLTVIWLFFTTYLMLTDKSRSYFWFVVAYVCLVILIVGPSPVGAFAIATYRTLETAMGIIVYTLVCVFIWPRPDAEAIKKPAGRDINYQHYSGLKIHVPEIENLKGALYVASVVFGGFIIWFYIDPPGHSMWFIMSGIFALIFAPMQPIKMTRLIFPLLFAMVLSSLIYVFILPELTNYFQLSILLFTCMFLIRFILSGLLSLVFTIVMIQMIAITNPQDYNVEGLINSFVYIPMIMMYLFIMSYIISSPRPEKAFLKLVRRFSKSASYLISQQAVVTDKPLSFFEHYKTAFYVHELKTLPGKITAWGKAIDKKLFPNTSNQQIEEMVSALQVIAIKIEALMEEKVTGRGNEHPEMLREVNGDWKQLLGSFLGVTQGTLLFSNTTDKIDWQQYKEERFQ